MLTIAQHLRNEGYARGEATGIKRGIKQGVERGKVDTFLKLARRKFGPVPPTRSKQVAEASVEQLDRWLDALIEVDSLDSVFADAQRG